MKAGVIANLIDYYVTNKEFAHEIERAGEEFFNHAENSADIDAGEDAEGLFNEWLVYDFVLASGKKFIEDFYDRNPRNLSQDGLRIYKDLQNNEYGMFEVLKVEDGRGMAIKSLQSAREYYVRERKATYQIKNGNIFPGRVGDHWEFIGADLFFFRCSDGPKDERWFYQRKRKINAKNYL